MYNRLTADPVPCSQIFPARHQAYSHFLGMGRIRLHSHCHVLVQHHRGHYPGSKEQKKLINHCLHSGSNLLKNPGV